MMYHHTSSLILEHITLESDWKGKCDWLSHYTHTHTQTYVLSISVTFLVNWLDSNVQCAIVDSDINQIFWKSHHDNGSDTFLYFFYK